MRFFTTMSSCASRYASLGRMLTACLFAWIGTAQAQVAISEYFVIEAGNRWMWSVNQQSVVGVQVSSVVDSTTLINGVETTSVLFSDGTQLFFSADQDGFKIHRLELPGLVPLQPGVFADLIVTLDPGPVFLTQVALESEVFGGSGTATIEIVGVGSGSVSYQIESTFVGIESVTVPAGTFDDAIRVNSTISLAGTLLGQPFQQSLSYEQWVGRSVGFVKFIQTVDGATFSTGELVSSNLIPSNIALAASNLPTSRSVQTGTAATFFSTIINAGSVTATQCRIAPATSLPVQFSYQTTDPATNTPTGTPDTPVDIPPNNGLQTFVLSLTPSVALAPTEVEFGFACTNSGLAGNIPGVNSLLLSASDTPVADVIALALTPSENGILELPGAFGANAFAVATVNVGSLDTITVSADTGDAALPVNIFTCETDPATGQCLSPPTVSETTTIDANATPTFTIFVNGDGAIASDPAVNRVFVRFTEADGTIRGSTSVALETL